MPRHMKKLIILACLYFFPLPAMNYTPLVLSLAPVLLPYASHYIQKKVQGIKNSFFSSLRDKVCLAATQNQPYYLQFLLSLGISPEITNSANNYYPLQLAVHNQSYEAAKILLHHGAKPTTTLTADQASPLELAMYHRNSRIFELLLQFTPDIENTHPPLLQRASQYFYPPLVIKLLSCGASTDSTVPLAIAITTANKYLNAFSRQVIKALIYAGADPSSVKILTSNRKIKKILENPLAIKQYCTPEEIEELDAMMEERRIALINQSFPKGSLLKQLDTRMITGKTVK